MQHPRTRLVVMAKAPVAGQAKTRLAPALGAEGAAALAARMLEHTLQAARESGLGEVTLACAPDASHPAFAAQAARGGLALVGQGDGGLGARMQRAFAQAFAAGAGRVLLIGTDAPALDAARLREAAAALATHDAVFVPTADGGYVLVGLARPAPFSLFDDAALPWSTPRVMAATRERLAAARWRWAELPTLHDIDEPADLVHLPAAWCVSLGVPSRPTRMDDDRAPIDALRRALRDARSPWADAPLEPLADKGLAHHHVRLVGSGCLARIPKQSQMGLAAGAALAYEAACFRRAAASGHVPALHGTLAPGAELPRGALLVDEVIGQPAALPQDLAVIAQALAAIHSLPLPAERTPLLDDADPLRALRAEINRQAEHLDAAVLDAGARTLIERARADFAALCARPERPPRRLIAFDGHPGNFLVRADGRAMLVDIEKARWSHPPLDLAHATLYTSTTWDVTSRAELSLPEVIGFYDAWQSRCDLGPALRPWFVPLRAAMWLWSVTWCAKWRVLSPRDASSGADGEDWSHHKSSDALIAHVRERVDDYLGLPAIERVVGELEALQRVFAGR
jgi:rSAM/selenodomain-associated transferase 1